MEEKNTERQSFQSILHFHLGFSKCLASCSHNLDFYLGFLYSHQHERYQQLANHHLPIHYYFKIQSFSHYWILLSISLETYFDKITENLFVILLNLQKLFIFLSSLCFLVSQKPLVMLAYISLFLSIKLFIFSDCDHPLYMVSIFSDIISRA